MIAPLTYVSFLKCVKMMNENKHNIHIRGVWGLKSRACEARELQLLPQVLSNLITATPNSTYMHITLINSYQTVICMH